MKIKNTHNTREGWLPVCPVDKKHGSLVCDMPEDADDIVLDNK